MKEKRKSIPAVYFNQIGESLNPVNAPLHAPYKVPVPKGSGVAHIDTAYEERQRIAVKTHKRQQKDASLYYYLMDTPLLTDFGSVKYNVGGAEWIVDVGTKDIKSNGPAELINIAAGHLMSYLKNMQYTNLEINDISPEYGLKSSAKSPFVRYIYATIKNTNIALKPIASVHRLLSYVRDMVSYDDTLVQRINTFLNQFSRSQWKASYASYLTAIKSIPIHKQFPGVLRNSMQIEKVNKSFNSTYHYVDVDVSVSLNDRYFCKLTGVQGSDDTDQGIIMSDEVIDQISNIPTIKEITQFLMTDNSTDFYAACNNMMLRMANALNAVTKWVSSYAMVFSPFISAMNVIGKEFLQPIFISNFDAHEFFSKNYVTSENEIAYMFMLAGQKFKTSSNSRTIQGKVPLLNDINVPEYMAGNGILFFKEIEGSIQDEQYLPLVDISGIKPITSLWARNSLSNFCLGSTQAHKYFNYDESGKYAVELTWSVGADYVPVYETRRLDSQVFICAADAINRYAANTFLIYKESDTLLSNSMSYHVNPMFFGYRPLELVSVYTEVLNRATDAFGLTPIIQVYG